MAPKKALKAKEELKKESNLVIYTTIEDLMNLSTGNIDPQKVDFTMLNAVIHTLSRQMRLLDHKVKLKADEAAAAKEITNDNKLKQLESNEVSTSDSKKEKGKIVINESKEQQEKQEMFENTETTDDIDSENETIENDDKPA